MCVGGKLVGFIVSVLLEQDEKSARTHIDLSVWLLFELVTFGDPLFWSCRKQRGSMVTVPHVCLPAIASADGQVRGKGEAKLAMTVALSVAVAFKGDVFPLFLYRGTDEEAALLLYQLLLLCPLYSK